MPEKSSPHGSLSSTGPPSYFSSLGEDGWAVWIVAILIDGALVLAILNPEACGRFSGGPGI